jgi:hypothetical protein
MCRTFRACAAICAAFAGLLSFDAAAFTVRGTVVNTEGMPIAGAHVFLTRERNSRSTLTGVDGRFSFEDVASGQIQLVVYADGFAITGIDGPCIRDEDVQLVLTPPQPTRLRVINQKFEPVEGARVSRMVVNDRFTVHVDDLAELGLPAVRSGEDGFLDLPPLPKYSFASVTIACNGFADAQLPALPAGIEDLDFPMPDGLPVVGRVTNGKGEAVQRARISIYRPREDGDPIHAAEAVTGPEGFYRALVPPGAYFAAARQPEYAMPAPIPLEVRELAGDAIADFRLPDPHRIDGRALDDTGSPVALARLEYHAGGYVVDEAVSDVRGRFELTVPSGQGAIHVTAPYRMATKEFPRVYFVIPDDEPIIAPSPIEFRPLPELAGTAQLADGSPASRTLIRSLNLDPPLFILTDESGAYTIPLDAFPEEPLQFVAEHALLFQRAEIQIKPANLTLREIRLREFAPDTAQYSERAENDLRQLVGRPAPEFACDQWLNVPAGAPAPSVAGLRGSVVVATMWAGFDYLGPSRARSNELNALHALYEGIDDVAFVGIHDSTVEPGDVARYVRELGIRYPVGCDQDPYETFARYLTQQIPQSVLIDKQGVVRYFATHGRLVELIKVLRNE